MKTMRAYLALLLVGCASIEPVEGTWQGIGSLDGVTDTCDLAPAEASELSLEMEIVDPDLVDIHLDYWPLISCEIDRQELDCDPSTFDQPVGLGLWADERYTLRLSGSFESATRLASDIAIQRRCEGSDCPSLGTSLDCDTTYSLTFEAGEAAED